MDVLQVLQLVDELCRVDVQVLTTAFLTDDTLGAFRVTTHVLAYLLVDLALGVYQTLWHMHYRYLYGEGRW